MNIIELINKKRLKDSLTFDEIKFIIDNYLNGNIKDYQISSLLMAICINDMSEEEIYNLTEVMLNSGNKIDLSMISGVKVDKHSTGGVGDKTTLIVGPMVASCGVIVAKMSGRSLGFTGGTIDKLESIKGFRTNLSNEEFINQVRNIGISVVSQTENLVPADKKIYALRDVTGTVESIPLIASSIMSKKLASGADKILLDVKYGVGALMKTKEDAIALAKLMVKIGNRHGKETIAILSDMNSPLGNMIGNGLEVKEAIDVLNYKGNRDLKDLCIIIASYMVSIAKNMDIKEARQLVIDNLINGNAYGKFVDLIRSQCGDINNIDISNNIIEIKSNRTGYINNIDALKIGKLTMKLGAGRTNKDDAIDYGVGIELVKHVGDFVNTGDVIAKIYIRNKILMSDEVLDAFIIEDALKQREPLVLGIIK
jgi:pyrimidine-nucleoside phosphorylase